METGDHVREVCAQFGRAIYHAQVLEHALANALLTLQLLPQRSNYRSQPELWNDNVDSFMDQQFSKTLGRLVQSLQAVAAPTAELESLLSAAHKNRNWLAHHFFRVHAEDFLTHNGRERMLVRIAELSEPIMQAERQLESQIQPLRESYGITDAMIEAELEKARRG